MNENATGTEGQAVAEATEKKVTVRIGLPTDYAGRCTGTQVFFATFVSSPIKGDENRYELRLAVPKDEVECQKFYGKSIEDLLAVAVRKLATDVDAQAKDVLFQLDEKTGAFKGYTAEAHTRAQQFIDAWKPSVRSGVSKTFLAIVAKLREMNILLPTDTPQTDDELKASVAERMGKKAKK